MALADAQWRGQAMQQIADHERRIKDVEEDVEAIRDGWIAHRARMGLLVAVCGLFGSGIGGALIAVLLGH